MKLYARLTSMTREVEQMAHWAIYVAYAWLGTIIFAFTDAVQAIRQGPRPKPQPLAPYNRN